MALTYDLTKIKNYEAVCWREIEEEKYINPKTEAIIFATMVVDIGDITEATVKEFYIRCVLAQRIFDYSTQEQPSWSGITPQDIKDHIGLRTNVTLMTRPKWIKKTIENATTEIARDWNRQAANV